MQFDQYDPKWPTRLHEAFDRIREFAPELHEAPKPPYIGRPTPVRDAYARIVAGDWFDRNDVAVVTDYGWQVAKTAREKSMTEGLPFQGAGPVLRAAADLIDTCDQFKKFVDHNCLKRTI